jgi:hypothetical protein
VKIRFGRWMAIYLLTYLVLGVAFALLVREDIVQGVLNDHMTLFTLTCAALSLLVTTIVDDVLDGRQDKEGDA